MKKSTFWLLLSIFWAVDAAIAIIRFFDIQIEIRNREGEPVKTISREGDRVTPIRAAIAGVSLLLSNLYCFLSFKARKREKCLVVSDQCSVVSEG